MSQKKEMPENIRKMFEQKNMQSNNFSEKQNEVEQPKIPQNAEQVESLNTNETLPQTEISQNVGNENVPQTENQAKTPPQKPKTKPEKKEKAKPEKKKNDNSKNKKKLPKAVKIILILVAIAVVVALSIILPIFFKKQQERKLTAPELKVYILSNQTILRVDENKDAVQYYFGWQKVENGESGDIESTDSNTNQISFNEKLTENSDVGTYEVWAKYKLSDGRDSKESKRVQVKFTKQLETVQIKKLEDGNLTFTNINKASYYKLFYDGKEFITVSKKEELGDITVNLARLFSEKNITPSAYNIYVQAIGSEQTYYTDSELSTPKEYVYQSKLDKITFASYQKSSNILEFFANTSDTIGNFQITLTFTDNTLQILEKSYKLSNSSLQLDLTSMLSTFGKTSQDVAKIEILAYSENKYIQNSDSVDVSLVE